MLLEVKWCDGVRASVDVYYCKNACSSGLSSGLILVFIHVSSDQPCSHEQVDGEEVLP